MSKFDISLFSLLKSNHLIEIDGLLLCKTEMATDTLLKVTCASRMFVSFYFEDRKVTVNDGECTAFPLFTAPKPVLITVKVVRNPTVADFDCLFA